MELFNWNDLGSCAGAAFAVALVTQATKEIPGIRALPTQLWSFMLALLTLLLSQAFTSGLTLSGAVLALFNAALVSLAANGGYAAIRRMQSGTAGGGAGEGE